MSSEIKSGISKPFAEKLLRGDQDYYGSPSSTIKFLDSSNAVYKDIHKEVTERQKHCPHSFSISSIEIVSAPLSRSQAFRRGMASLADPNIHLLFHGTKESHHTSIFDQGFSLNDDHYGDTDKGYIGKGVYLSPFPEYCAAYIKETPGVTRLRYFNPVTKGTTFKLLGCIAIVGRTRQLHQKDFGTEIESTLESRWAWVRNDGEVTASPSEFFAQEYAIKLPQYVYPRFRITLTRVQRKEVIWVDTKISNSENSRYLSELKQDGTISIYATASSSEALNALKKADRECRAVTAGHGGEDHVRAMRSAGINCPVLVFCGAVDYHRQWASKAGMGNVKVTNSAAEFKKFATWK